MTNKFVPISFSELINYSENEGKVKLLMPPVIGLTYLVDEIIN